MLLLSLESPEKFQEMLGGLVEEILKLPEPPPALFRPEFLKSSRSREIALAHPNIPQETVIELAGSEDYYTRGLAAAHPLLPEVFRRILRLPQFEYNYTPYPRLQNPAGFPTLTEEEFETLLSGPNWFRYLLSTLPSTPPEVLTRLANTSGLSVQQTIAANRKTPTETLRELSFSSDGIVQSAIANNPSTPPDVLARYASQSIMAFYLPANPSLPLSVGLQMLEHATKATGDVTYAADLLRRPDLPEEKLREFLTDKRKEWRAALAKNPALSGEMLAVLAADRSLEVKINLAARKELPEEIMERLSRDKAAKVRAGLAINPSISLALMTRLAEDPEVIVRAALARNHNLNRVVMSQLKKDDSDTVRSDLFKTHAKVLRK